MSQAFLDEYGLLLPLLEIIHINQAVDVLLMGLTCVSNILSEEYKINKLVEAGLIGVARPLSGHEDERVQQYVAGVFLAISSCPGLEEWLVRNFTQFSGSTRACFDWFVALLLWSRAGIYPPHEVFFIWGVDCLRFPQLSNRFKMGQSLP